MGDLGLIPGLGRSPGDVKGYPLQYSGLENSMGLQRVGHDWENFTSHHDLLSFQVLVCVYFLNIYAILPLKVLRQVNPQFYPKSYTDKQISI